MASGCRLWRYFRAPERATSRRFNHLPSTWLAWFRCSGDGWPQDVGSGGIPEPQRGPAGGYRISLLASQVCPRERRHSMYLARSLRRNLCPRECWGKRRGELPMIFRCPTDSRFWRYSRAPERAGRRVSNHSAPTKVTVFRAPEAPPPRLSVLAVFPSPREGRQ